MLLAVHFHPGWSAPRRETTGKKKKEIKKEEAHQGSRWTELDDYNRSRDPRHASAGQKLLIVSIKRPFPHRMNHCHDPQGLNSAKVEKFKETSNNCPVG